MPGLAGLCSPASLNVVSPWHVADNRSLKFGFGLEAATTAAAAARLAQTATKAVLVPCSADAYSGTAPSGSLWGSETCPLGYTKADQLKYLKHYERVDVPSTLSLLTPYKLMWLLLKNTGLVFLLQTNMWLYQALDAEEQALQQGTQAQLPPYPDVLQQLVKSCWNSWRELLTALTRSEIKHAINSNASSRVAWKILKDPRKSITDKATWYVSTPAWKLLPRYIKTMLQTQVPMYAAEFVVACVYDAVDECRRILKGLRQQILQQQSSYAASERLVGAECLVGTEQDQQGSLQQLQETLQQLLAGQVRIAPAELQLSSRRWLLKAGKNLVRVTGTALCAAVGAGVAASLAPRERAGVWAWRGHIVSDLIFANVLMVVLDGGVAIAFAPGHSEQEQHQQHGPLHFGLAT